jgi:hypothetical protein
MGRPRIPTNVQHLKGAFKKDPQRLKERENEPENVNPVGEPPDYLSDEAKSAWRQIVSESIEGVLGEADRIAVEMASGLYAKAIGEGLNPQEHNQFFRYLSQFGMMPADRSKISVPKKKPANKFDVKSA